MFAELLTITVWIGVWIITSLFLTVIVEIYYLLTPNQEYVKHPNFLKQWLKILLIIPLFMP